MRVRGRRTAACATAVLAAMVLTSCQSDDGGDDLPAATSASPTQDAEATRAAGVLEAFWAERVRVESSGRYGSADFDGILSPRMIEPQLQQYQQYEQSGFRRVGKPELRDFTAEVDGDSAVATVCVQEDDWGAKADVKIVQPDPQGWYASSHRLKRSGDDWLIVDTAEPPAGTSC